MLLSYAVEKPERKKKTKKKNHFRVREKFSLLRQVKSVTFPFLVVAGSHQFTNCTVRK